MMMIDRQQTMVPLVAVQYPTLVVLLLPIVVYRVSAFVYSTDYRPSYLPPVLYHQAENKISSWRQISFRYRYGNAEHRCWHFDGMYHSIIANVVDFDSSAKHDHSINYVKIIANRSSPPLNRRVLFVANDRQVMVL